METDAVISPLKIEEILQKWVTYDTEGSGFISPENLAFFLFELNHPLGFKEDTDSLNFNLDKKKNSKNYIVNFKKKMVIHKKNVLKNMKNFPVFLNFK